MGARSPLALGAIAETAVDEGASGVHAPVASAIRPSLTRVAPDPEDPRASELPAQPTFFSTRMIGWRHRSAAEAECHAALRPSPHARCRRRAAALMAAPFRNETSAGLAARCRETASRRASVIECRTTLSKGVVKETAMSERGTHSHTTWRV
jgi:hypothetical protein